VFAHNFQDYRRKPNLFRYDTELCEDWQSGTFITAMKKAARDFRPVNSVMDGKNNSSIP